MIQQDLVGFASVVHNWAALRAFSSGAAQQIASVDAKVVAESSRNGWFRLGQVVGHAFMAVLGGVAQEGAAGLLEGGAAASGKSALAAQLPKYLYHYTSEETADLIESSSLYLGRIGRTLYLTPDGGLSPLQAGIDLALPQTNTAGALFRIPTSALEGARIIRVGPVTGNMLGRAGGGIEVLYNGRVPLELVKRIR